MVFRLAKVLNADVVITISALRTLANNSKPFSNEWEMPMTIKEIEGRFIMKNCLLQTILISGMIKLMIKITNQNFLV